MNEFDVMSFRRSSKEKAGRIQCCELENGNRFIMQRIEIKGTDVIVKLADGTTAKPHVIKTIYEFGSAAEAQSFLLNR
jgi:hypothetical protein